MSKDFQSISQLLNSDEIIDCDMNGNVHRVDKLLSLARSLFKKNIFGTYLNHLSNHKITFLQGKSVEDFCENGVECKVLRTNGSGWKNAKIRFRVVLEIELEDEENDVKIPDISPLDDIRQSIQAQNEE